MDINQENINQDKQIAKAIHYPRCWDTMAYPTLASALWEMIDIEGKLCTSCGKSQGLSINSG